LKLERYQTTGLGLLIIHVGALAALLPTFFSWSGVLLVVVLYSLTGLSITLCYHRSLTHRGLRLSRPLEYATVILAALALEGGPIEWVSTHRKHHAFSDEDDDPHSMAKGFWWAHCGWLFRRNAAMLTPDEVRHYAPELVDVPFYRWVDRSALLLQLALAAGLYALGGWSWVVWGIFVRLVVCYHITWMINSVAHMIGYRTFKTADRSTNCWWLALISWGEGWHNNHHAFPFSARLGLRWFEFDPPWLMLRVLRLLRLAHEVKIPSREMLERLRGAAAAPKARRPARAA
jgi:fatty-acid desaturase